MSADSTTPQDDLVRTLDRLAAGAGQSTQRNTSLPQPSLAPAIPARTGSALSAAPTNA